MLLIAGVACKYVDNKQADTVTEVYVEPRQDEPVIIEPRDDTFEVVPVGEAEITVWTSTNCHKIKAKHSRILQKKIQ